MDDNRVDIPRHELSNYRIALTRFQKHPTKKNWDAVRGNALRVAERIDERVSKVDRQNTT